jgi:Kelch motif.
MIPFVRILSYGNVVLPNTAFDGNYEPVSYTAMSARAEMGYCSTDSGEIYAMGGVLSSTYYRDFWKYNPVSDSWSQLAQFGTTRSAPAMAYDSTNNIVYSFGGSTSVPAAGSMRNDLFSYNPTTNAWTQVTGILGTVPAARLHASLEYYDSKLWLFGSYTTLAAANTASVFDISTKTWTALPTSPYPMALGTRMVRIGSDMYVMGASGSTEYLMRFDTLNSTWSTTLSTTEKIGRLAAYKGIIVMFGYDTGNMFTFVPGNSFIESVGTIPNYGIDCNIFANVGDNFILTLGGKNSSGSVTSAAYKLT